MRDVVLAKDLRRAVALGHPWIYDRALAPVREPLAPGELVRLRDRRGPLAVGFADPASPIRVRVLSRAPEPPPRLWVAERARRAGALRRADPRLAETDAIRLIHGEADFMPGLVVDLYGDTAVVVMDGEAAAAVWTPALAEVRDGLAAAGFSIARLWQRRRGRPGRLLAGDPPPATVIVQEAGARFEVDLHRGQKTGLFLDQRDNRRYLRELAGGAEVLNLYGYTGGFSIHAALGGARRVVTVDVAAPAIEAAARNLALSGLDRSRHELVCADAPAWLERAAAAGRRFDIVVCDPPSFAPREGALPAARRAYLRINRLALALVAPGGLLLTASCSSHLTRAHLREAVAGAAAAAGRAVVVRGERGAASDHPVLPAFPEGDYLKLLDCHAG
ncbi:MAG TPA: class I SAM-dependent rRNA methyltransferase [Kofleriaceae bacterium]|nr:class I SAM-dependent rRNA methyltransferase [Kofleriaceae bacterium]